MAAGGRGTSGMWQAVLTPAFSCVPGSRCLVAGARPRSPSREHDWKDVPGLPGTGGPALEPEASRPSQEARGEPLMVEQPPVPGPTGCPRPRHPLLGRAGAPLGPQDPSPPPEPSGPRPLRVLRAPPPRGRGGAPSCHRHPVPEAQPSRWHRAPGWGLGIMTRDTRSLEQAGGGSRASAGRGLRCPPGSPQPAPRLAPGLLGSSWEAGTGPALGGLPNPWPSTSSTVPPESELRGPAVPLETARLE